MNHPCLLMFKTHTKKLIIVGALFAGHHAKSAWAAAAQVRGQVGIVGDYQSELGVKKSRVLGNRMPFSLQLEAKPADNLTVGLGLVYGANRYPHLAPQLGAGDPPTAFLSPKAGGRGEKSQNLIVDRAYLSWDSDFGLFQAGRLTRHWGLGLVRNSTWLPEGGTISFSDALKGSWDFDAFQVSLYWEKALATNLTSKEADYDGFTVEATLVGDPLDADEKGFQRSLGIAFTQMSQNSTSTRLMLLDVYGQFYWPQFLLEAEIYYPSGKTKSPEYKLLGGAGPCTPGAEKTCESQNIQAFGGLMRTRWSLTGAGDKNTLASLLATRVNQVPTSQRLTSHMVTLTGGFASGDKNGFGGPKGDNTIGSIPFHPNVRPSLLMFSTHLPYTMGMPGSVVQNAYFLKGEYTFESAGFGALTPSVVWAMLHRASSSLDTDSLSEGQVAEEKGLGRFKQLGVELDITYSYLTRDRVELGVVGGLWFPGKAWKSFTNDKPNLTYGVRSFASVTF